MRMLTFLSQESLRRVIKAVFNHNQSDTRLDQKKMCKFRLPKLLTLVMLLPLTSFALTPFKLALDWYVNPDQAPILVAQAKGYFKKNGLNVSLLTPTNISEPLQLLSLKKVNVAMTYAPRLVMDAAKGMPLMRIATIVPSPLDCLTTLASSGIKNPGDLKGKTIGYSSGAFGNAMLKLMLSRYHLSLKDVHLVDTKMNLIQALLTHRVDAVSGMMRSVEPIEIQHMGYQVKIFYPENYGMPRYEELILVANRHTVNQAKYRAFVKSMIEASEYLEKHPKKSWILASKRFKTALAPTDHMAKINKAIWMASIPYFAHNPAFLNQKSYMRLSHFLFKNYMIRHIPKKSLYLKSWV